ncbi:hypothetical protein AVEN_177858-1 [Araneus ventricosus]|uniref:Uncharacterized protein n=1 Tax=Araneus ventricosus TaxID=182803 RepID=A0A4Y2KQR6_ARAVE|nr:hypothetical protein AVEN_177858-1 [Araneus ventricosus]
MFHNIFDTVPKRPVGKFDNLYFILDGGSLIHRVVWPKQETFETISKQSFKKGAFHFANFVATDDAVVHIVNTDIETYEKIKKQVVVIGQDVDLLVLPTALTPDYMDILMLKEGKERKRQEEIQIAERKRQEEITERKRQEEIVKRKQQEEIQMEERSTREEYEERKRKDEMEFEL